MLFMVIHVVIVMFLATVKLTDIFFTRIANHMGISNLTGQCVKIVKKSAISDYLLEFVCRIVFLNTSASK